MEDQIRRRMSIEEFVTTLNRVMSAVDRQFSTAGSELEAESDFAGQSFIC
jgi:hypothetical protein